MTEPTVERLIDESIKSSVLFCPHCGAEYGSTIDHWEEIDGDGASCHAKLFCDCGKTFWVRRRTVQLYTTYRSDPT